MEGLRLSPSLTLFKELNETFDLATYLRVLCNSKYRWALSGLRLSSQSLAIETGRHNNIQREDRKCIFCNLNDLEDEYHFIIKCPLYNNIRTEYIPNYYLRNPSVYKFIELLKCTNVKKKTKTISSVCYNSIWNKKLCYCNKKCLIYMCGAFLWINTKGDNL